MQVDIDYTIKDFVYVKTMHNYIILNRATLHTEKNHM